MPVAAPPGPRPEPQTAANWRRGLGRTHSTRPPPAHALTVVPAPAGMCRMRRPAKWQFSTNHAGRCFARGRVQNLKQRHTWRRGLGPNRAARLCLRHSGGTPPATGVSSTVPGGGRRATDRISLRWIGKRPCIHPRRDTHRHDGCVCLGSRHSHWKQSATAARTIVSSNRERTSRACSQRLGGPLKTGS